MPKAASLAERLVKASVLQSATESAVQTVASLAERSVRASVVRSEVALAAQMVATLAVRLVRASIVVSATASALAGSAAERLVSKKGVERAMHLEPGWALPMEKCSGPTSGQARMATSGEGS